MMKSVTMSPKVNSPSSIQHSDDEKLSQLDMHTNEHEHEVNNMDSDDGNDDSVYLSLPREGNWREYTQTKTKTGQTTSTLFDMGSTPQKSDDSTARTVGNPHCHSSSNSSCSCS